MDDNLISHYQELVDELRVRLGFSDAELSGVIELDINKYLSLIKLRVSFLNNKESAY